MLHINHGSALASHNRPGTLYNQHLAATLPHHSNQVGRCITSLACYCVCQLYVVVMKDVVGLRGTIWLGRLDEVDAVMVSLQCLPYTTNYNNTVQSTPLSGPLRLLPAYFSPEVYLLVFASFFYFRSFSPFFRFFSSPRPLIHLVMRVESYHLSAIPGMHACDMRSCGQHTVTRHVVIHSPLHHARHQNHHAGSHHLSDSGH